MQDDHITGLQQLRQLQAEEAVKAEERVGEAVAATEAETRQWLEHVQALRCACPPSHCLTSSLTDALTHFTNHPLSCTFQSIYIHRYS